MTSASVVILSYRPGHWLADAVTSVLDQADEVIVVDNGSAAASAGLVARPLGARVVRSERNLGFAGGVNLGVKAASGELIALLNDDAVAGPGWIAAAATALSEAKVAAVAPKVRMMIPYREVILADPDTYAPNDPRPLGRQLRSVTVDGVEVLADLIGPGVHRLEESGDSRWRWTAGPRPWYVPASPEADVVIDGETAPPGPTCRLVNSAGLYLRVDGYAGDVGLGSPDDGRFDERQDRFGLSGTALVTRAETWRRLGGLAGEYFAYYEDVDWCWRANLAGWRLIYDPSSTVEHLRSATSGGASAVRVMAERNRTLTMVRNGPRTRAYDALAVRWRGGPDGGVRRGIARLLPWALASRMVAAPHWACKPADVWERWAGVGTAWDDGPCRLS